MCGESGLRQAADLEIQGYRINADCPHAHTNTEDFRLERLTFALHTETGSRNFRVEILGKALMFRQQDER